jgi:mRNA interferase MazF
MERFIKGDVVILPFPFSDLSQTKRRPALVINQLDGNDLILCAITSQIKLDKYAVAIENNDFASGSLNRNSYVRVNRLFTAENKIIDYKIGHLKPQKITEIINRLIETLQN